MRRYEVTGRASGMGFDGIGEVGINLLFYHIIEWEPTVEIYNVISSIEFPKTCWPKISYYWVGTNSGDI